MASLPNPDNQTKRRGGPNPLDFQKRRRSTSRCPGGPNATAARWLARMADDPSGFASCLDRRAASWLDEAATLRDVVRGGNQTREHASDGPLGRAPGLSGRACIPHRRRAGPGSSRRGRKGIRNRLVTVLPARRRSGSRLSDGPLTARSRGEQRRQTDQGSKRQAPPSGPATTRDELCRRLWTG